MRRLPFAITAAVSVSIAVLIIVLWRRKGVDPVKGRITSRYGMRNGNLHNGTDIAVAVGTPVKSPWRGTVSETYTNSAGGKQIIINHPNGYRTGYAHLSEYRVSAGQRVRRGQVIALSGNTGGSTGPHLHFTLRKDGERIDPESVFDFK